MELTFLGTSCMVPTKERNAQGIFLSYKNEGILIDCGEGTQRQMNIAGINRNKVTKILLTHWHGDHVGGLIGLIQTIGNQAERPELHIFGPYGTKKHLAALFEAVMFDVKVHVEVHELNPGGVEKAFDASDYELWVAPMEHSVPCIAYAFVEKDVRKVDIAKAKTFGLGGGPLVGKLQRGQSVNYKGKDITPDDVTAIKKGRKLTFVFDTVVNEMPIALAKDADLLVCEAAYASDLEEKAEQYKHMTTKHAAQIATSAGVKQLIITHFSQRYKTDEKLQEIKDFFANSSCAYDFMKVKL